MATRKFWLLLGGTTLVALACLVVLDALFPAVQSISPFTFICVGVFLVINVVAYFLGKRAALNASKFRFVPLMMALIFAKMIVCVVLVVAYTKIGQPASRLFVIPFLLVYLIFTGFEIYVLEKLARMKPHSETAVGQRETVES